MRKISAGLLAGLMVFAVAFCVKLDMDKTAALAVESTRIVEVTAETAAIAAAAATTKKCATTKRGATTKKGDTTNKCASSTNKPVTTTKKLCFIYRWFSCLKPDTTTKKAVATTKKSASTTKKAATTTKKAATTAKKTTTTTIAANTVPKQYIGGTKSGPLSWSEYQQARAAAEKLVAKYAGKSREEQVRGVYKELRAMVDKGSVGYSMEAKHYADPYGYLVLKVASCAGSARTAGLCLDVLGLSWEHVHPNQYCHQWARVKVGSEYWICDPYGMYVGKEPSPYKHPTLD